MSGNSREQRSWSQTFREGLHFAWKFIQNPKALASIMPSSPMLAEAVTEPIDWEKVKTVVEVGAGTGPVTKVIVEKARAETKLFAIELDTDFAGGLRRRFEGVENLTVLEANALSLRAVLAEHEIQTADAIVSGLGIALFSKEQRDQFFGEVKQLLAEGGVYTQITETVSEKFFGHIYREYFNDVRFVPVPVNIPPAGVFICRDPK